MAKYFTTFDSPKDYPNAEQYFIQGESPRLLHELLTFIDERKNKIEEIYLSLPYFNNPYLNQALKKLGQEGIKVHVVTLPIQVFDQKKIQWYIDLATGKEAFDMAKTSYQLARPIFAEHFKTPSENYQLHCFAHSPIRMDAQIGDDTYSLENNLALFIYKQGGGALASTSSSLSVGKMPAENHLIIIEDNWDLLKSALRFFKQLIDHSIIIHHFDFKEKNQHQNFTIQDLDQKLPAFFIAPFFKDAAFHAEEQLSNLMQKAKKRIYIASPNLDAYEYEYDGTYHSDLENEIIENFGIQRTLLEQAGAGMEVHSLSAQKSNTSGSFFELYKVYPDTSFDINPNLKSSFLIVDDQLVLFSSELTSEQFIFLDQVKIHKNEELIYSGVFSKINHFIIIDDEKTVNIFLNQFERLANSGQKIK